MDPAVIGAGGLMLAGLLMALRLPTAAVLAGTGVLGRMLDHAVSGGMPVPAAAGAALSDVVSDLTALTGAPGLVLLPLFIGLGNIAFYSGVSTRIYDAASVWLRPLPGGAAMASVIGCGGFSALSGSSVGCASTMGRICVPEMTRLGYDPRLATASVAVGGTLGSLIPPSLLFILFGIFTGIPVERLFLAGLLPGLLSLAGMVLVIAWWVRDDPAAGPPGDEAGASRSEALSAIWPALLLFGVIVGGLSTGVLTALWAGLICIALTFAIGVAQGRLSAEVLWRAVRKTLVQSVFALLIVAAGPVFFGMIAATGIASVIVDWIALSDVTYYAVILVAVLVCLALGMFIEPVGILILTLPLMLPVVQGYGLDPIWFAVVVVKMLEIALITPPVGLNVFVIGNVSRDVGTDAIFAGVARFLPADLFVLVLLILFPAISTLIPSLMGAG